MNKIILKPGRSHVITHNKDPLIFSGAIKKIVGNPLVADLVEVYDDHKKLIGTGFYNPYSNYRVRLLTFAKEVFEQQIPTIIKQRIVEAIAKRTAQQLPNEHTSVYRLVNSEADLLSGLTIDCFNQTVVASVTAYWAMFYREIIVRILHELGFAEMIWKPQKNALGQDGWKIDIDEHVDTRLMTVRENNIVYQVDIGAGQKTGFYCDQRENRLVIRELANDKTVLDVCCYSGGFALNAAIGGAKKVVGVDSSATAIALAQQNTCLNEVSSIEFVVAKAEEYLKACEKFDVIILDPPKLAPRKQHVNQAKQRYIKLNTLAMQAINPGGYLFTFSCSNAISLDIFIAVIKVAAEKANKKIKIISTHSAGRDHPYVQNAGYGNYLKGCLISVDN